jgi:hypothetical protein
MRVTLAAGLALVTLLGALAIPSAAWLVPALAIVALVHAPSHSFQPLTPQLPEGLLSAALGASIGLAFMLGVMAL